jgi:hypothetical protein
LVWKLISLHTKMGAGEENKFRCINIQLKLTGLVNIQT